MKNIYWILSLLLFVSCTKSQNEKTANLLKKWSGREILFPKNSVFSSLGKDTIGLLEIEYDYAIVSYVDSSGCTNCKLQLDSWNDFLEKRDSIFNKKVELFFFLHPRDRREMVDILSQYNFTHPVCLDLKNDFYKLNNLEDIDVFQTFLIDKNNKIIAIGNPVHNSKVKELYKNIIWGKEIYSRSSAPVTNATVAYPIFDMGSFDWKKPQQANFTIKNAGTDLLVINDIVTSCGCTKVDYSKEPVKTNGELNIQVTYTAEEVGRFNKTLTVYYNGTSPTLKLSIKGNANK